MGDKAPPLVLEPEFNVREANDGFECILTLRYGMRAKRVKHYALSFNAVRSLVKQIIAQERKHNNIIGVDALTTDEVADYDKRVQDAIFLLKSETAYSTSPSDKPEFYGQGAHYDWVCIGDIKPRLLKILEGANKNRS